jgi:Protein of unknown function (DUF2911)
MKMTRFAAMLCCLCLVLGGSAIVLAQAAPKTVLSPPMMAKVSVGGGDVTIDYGAPSVRGRKIFGGLVPYGEVWRTGANPATTLTTTVSLKIGDLDVPAGKYTVYSLPTAEGWQLIINKQTGQWGTVYDKSQDLGRTKMTVGTTPAPVEMFVIDFEKTADSATELHLKWAGVDASVPVTVSK